MIKITSLNWDMKMEPYLDETNYSFLIGFNAYKKKNFELIKYIPRPSILGFYQNSYVDIINSNFDNNIDIKLGSYRCSSGGPSLLKNISTIKTYTLSNISFKSTTPDLTKIALISGNNSDEQNNMRFNSIIETPEGLTDILVSSETMSIPVPTSYTSCGAILFLDKYSEKAAFLYVGNNATYRRCALSIGTLNRDTGAVTSTQIYSNTALPAVATYPIQILEFLNDDVVLATGTNYDNKIILVSYSFSANSTTTLINTTDAQLLAKNYYNRLIDLYYNENDGKYHLYYAGVDVDNNNLVIRTLTVSSSLSSVIDQPANAIITNEWTDNPEFASAITGYNTFIRTKIFDNNGNTYLIVYGGSRQGNNLSKTNSNSELISKIHLFSLNKEDGSLTYIGSYTIDDPIIDLIGYDDMSSGLIMTPDRIYPFAFDGTTFTLGAPINMVANTISIDSFGRFWVVDAQHNLYIMSPIMPATVEIKLAESVRYAGEDINTNLIVNTYNYKGERVVATLELVGINPNVFVFSDTGTNRITVTTSDSGDTLVPITIKSTGEIMIEKTIKSIGG